VSPLLSLVGVRIDRALWDGESVYLVLLDGRIAKLSPRGECCANAYIQHINNPEALVVAEVMVVEDLEVTDADEARVLADEGVPDEDRDIWGHRIITNRGTCVLDCRTEHNGYYYGWLDLTWVQQPPDNARDLEET
jgi:hypothetical protein